MKHIRMALNFFLSWERLSARNFTAEKPKVRMEEWNGLHRGKTPHVKKIYSVLFERCNL